MFGMIRNACVLCALMCCGLCARGGVVVFNDGSFSYQGYLEVDGSPANGSYSFRFEAFNDPTGFDIASDLFFTSALVPVVDGLFVVEVQMGGTPEFAREFWMDVGNQDMYLEIGVSEIEGGDYETLGTRVPMGWGARAQYSVFSEALIFPYSDLYSDPEGDLNSMVSLHNLFGGSVLELEVGNNENPAVLSVKSATPFGLDYGTQTGGVHIDTAGRQVGLISIADEYAIAGILTTNTGSQNSAILGQVNSGVIGATAITALNTDSGTQAYLGSPEHAGLFEGDVVVNGDARFSGEATRDFGFQSPSPVGPLAYGSISSGGVVTAGTANLSASWDAVNSRYVVRVAGESLTYQTHQVQITVVELGGPHVATYVTSGGDLWVKIWAFDASGFVAIEDNFSIVIYSPDSVVVSRTAVPEGVDTDKYTEATGEALIQTRPRYEPVEELDRRGIQSRD